ncbi:MAG: helix-turn-helix transcriptional regulator [Dehalococcoidia bacterium]
MSQFDLSLEAEISSRHLSFVETGRSRPSRQLLLRLADHLDIPLRERNALLLAAGFAPIYPEHALDTGDLAPVRAALDRLLSSHEPFPAIAVDRHWDLLAANRSALGLFTQGVEPHLLEPPVNALRVTLHPGGLAPRIANLGEYAHHLISRLRRHVEVSGDPALSRLLDEIRGYPGLAAAHPEESPGRIFVPLVLRSMSGPDLTFFSTIATFGTALDITVSEIAVESFFPADEITHHALRSTTAAR